MIIAPEKSKPADNYLILSNISWEKFEQIEITFADVEGVRFVYLDGELGIMILGAKHEYYKRTISLLLEAYLRATNIRFYSGGSATLGNKNITGRKEPDESYRLDNKKEIPDLVIEVIISSGNINILEIYRRIGIPEVWFYEDGGLTVYSLIDQQYNKVNHSNLLPDLNLEIVTEYINHPDQYDAVTELVNEL
ncbi:Uma2 family endonuclease [Synechocystis sp. PCC 7338]|uniref:Uma2 family endonuclease n=1 Tax=Synechocystis sp. PCC 7338 TaxID=2732530 RepID=UPI001BAFD3F6|nr:Uma2 family endonuclease [Synechocystis sp. PCC 7338]QUS59965.1 Uma2 family endonuclease [Synechocystis sp. PCC 7338]